MDWLLCYILFELIVMEMVQVGGFWNIVVDRNQVENVVVVLVFNVWDVMLDGGIIMLEMGNFRLDDVYIGECLEELELGCYVMFVVIDMGEGMLEMVWV